jgi:hypothetical protein
VSSLDAASRPASELEVVGHPRRRTLASAKHELRPNMKGPYRVDSMKSAYPMEFTSWSHRAPSKGSVVGTLRASLRGDWREDARGRCA